MCFRKPLHSAASESVCGLSEARGGGVEKVLRSGLLRAATVGTGRCCPPAAALVTHSLLDVSRHSEHFFIHALQAFEINAC